MTRAWPPGSATGIGSLPGTDPHEAVRLVLGELPDLPHLPELPDRGFEAQLVGRGAALLVDLPTEIAASGWQLTAHDGRDIRRARDLLARDLDALEELADGVATIKVQAAGPWTLAAGIELPSGHKILTDHGATRDLVASLAEGLRLHVQDVGRRVPGARIVLQLDEPSLPAVLGGRIGTPSGWGTVRAIDDARARQGITDVFTAAHADARVVHCCAPDVPIGLLHEAGVDALSLDAALLTRAHNDQLGEAVDAGTSLWLGVLPGVDAEVTLDQAREPIRRLWSELGFPAAQAADAIVSTPSCGLAGASPEYVRRVFALLRDAGHALRDESE